jgi:hypothetical protein
VAQNPSGAFHFSGRKSWKTIDFIGSSCVSLTIPHETEQISPSGSQPISPALGPGPGNRIP